MSDDAEDSAPDGGYIYYDPIAARIDSLRTFAETMHAVEKSGKAPLTLTMMNEVMVAAAMTLGAKAGELHDIEDANHSRVLRELKRN